VLDFADRTGCGTFTVLWPQIFILKQTHNIYSPSWHNFNLVHAQIVSHYTSFNAFTHIAFSALTSTMQDVIVVVNCKKSDLFAFSIRLIPNENHFLLETLNKRGPNLIKLIM
jgi:hypothetical protein